MDTRNIATRIHAGQDRIGELDPATGAAKRHGRKQQTRTKKTRELLLQAAETVFVRDGFEKAALSDIAELAGRTRGAIYAQFRDKEEVFLELVEKHVLRRGAILQELLAESVSNEGVPALLRARYKQLAPDDPSALLLMEFQLYAVRHPSARETISEIYRRVPPSRRNVQSAPTGTRAENRNIVDRAVAVHTALAVLAAFQIGIRTSPVPLDQRSAETIAWTLMKAFFEPLQAF